MYESFSNQEGPYKERERDDEVACIGSRPDVPANGPVLMDIGNLEHDEFAYGALELEFWVGAEGLGGIGRSDASPPGIRGLGRVF